ncbi:hypothetical protein GQ472_01980 [archaeon]|nr:hypothetical protein [archaeon]
MSETLNGTKALGEIPAGAILGMTENVSIGTAITFGILLAVIGGGMYFYGNAKKGKLVK